MTIRGLLALASVPVIGLPLGYLAELVVKGQFKLPALPRVTLVRFATLRAILRP